MNGIEEVRNKWRHKKCKGGHNVHAAQEAMGQKYDGGDNNTMVGSGN